MSSPTIITGRRMEYEAARASNRESIEELLQEARVVYAQVMDLTAKLTQLDPDTTLAPTVPFDQASARAWHLYNNDGEAGFAGVQYAHAYWQALKHQCRADALGSLTEARLRLALQARKEQERLLAVSEALQTNTEPALAVERLTAPRAQDAAPKWSSEIAAASARIASFSVENADPNVNAAIAAARAKPSREGWLALEAICVRLGEQVKERDREQALRLYQAERRTLLRARIAPALADCRARLEELGAEAAEPLARELEKLESKLDGDVELERCEDQLYELRTCIADTARKQNLLQEAIKTLRAQGYELITVMQTLHPKNIASAYLADTRDESRVVHVQASDEAGLLSAEVLRRQDSDGSSRQATLDAEAQARLCHAMHAAEVALAETWSCSVVKRTAPGEIPLRVKSDIPQRRTQRRSASAIEQRKIDR